MSPEGCQRAILRLARQRLLLNICTLSIQVNLQPVDAVTNVDDVGWQNMVAPGRGVQYVHWVMHKCIMVKVGRNEMHVKHVKSR